MTNVKAMAPTEAAIPYWERWHPWARANQLRDTARAARSLGLFDSANNLENEAHAVEMRYFDYAAPLCVAIMFSGYSGSLDRLIEQADQNRAAVEAYELSLQVFHVQPTDAVLDASFLGCSWAEPEKKEG